MLYEYQPLCMFAKNFNTHLTTKCPTILKVERENLCSDKTSHHDMAHVRLPTKDPAKY